MKKIKQKIQAFNKEAILLIVIIGIQVLYAGYMILELLLTIFGWNIKVLGNPAILFSVGKYIIFSFGIYAIIMYAGISFFRRKTYGWYGEVTLYIILLLKNIFFVLLITVPLFKESLFKNIPFLTEMKLNWKVVWVIIEFFISGLMVKLLFSNDTINRFNLKNNTRVSLIIKVSVIVVIAIILYFRFYSLLF